MSAVVALDFGESLRRIRSRVAELESDMAQVGARDEKRHIVGALCLLSNSLDEIVEANTGPGIAPAIVDRWIVYEEAENGYFANRATNPWHLQFYAVLARVVDLMFDERRTKSIEQTPGEFIVTAQWTQWGVEALATHCHPVAASEVIRAKNDDPIGDMRHGSPGRGVIRGAAFEIEMRRDESDNLPPKCRGRGGVKRSLNSIGREVFGCANRQSLEPVKSVALIARESLKSRPVQKQGGVQLFNEGTKRFVTDA